MGRGEAMLMRRAEREAPFEDYYYVLDLHPDADSMAIDEAYWRLARAYNAALRTDASARPRLDRLNEAYQVLASPKLRREYDEVRNAVLGEGAPPQAPRAKPPPPPLVVMERQRPKPRTATEAQRPRRWAGVLPSGRALATLILALIVGIAALTVLR